MAAFGQIRGFNPTGAFGRQRERVNPLAAFGQNHQWIIPLTAFGRNRDWVRLVQIRHRINPWRSSRKVGSLRAQREQINSLAAFG